MYLPFAEKKAASNIIISHDADGYLKTMIENIPNLCPLAQTSRAEVAQCKV